MRNKRLDVLRCVAVLVVLLHHWTLLHFFVVWGWVGVDLFFVLSGFLISGLLFSEYKKRQSVSFKRFFIRRALKIYPAFYLFLGFTAVADYLSIHRISPPVLYGNEALFVMNYLGGVFPHTWSLGVEEHFYLLLPIFLLFLIRNSAQRDDPFRALPAACLFIALACILTRAISASAAMPNYDAIYMETHNRMDALSCGVFLGYLHHFRPAVLERLMRSVTNRVLIALVSVALLSSAYFIPRESRFFAIAGFMFIYLGWAGILLLSLHVNGILPALAARAMKRMGSVFAYIGMFSYSIYLWQGQAETRLSVLAPFADRFPYARLAIYLAGNVMIGVVMSKLIEYPVLRLRDRLFPAIQRVPSGSSSDISSLPSIEPGSFASAE